MARAHTTQAKDNGQDLTTDNTSSSTFKALSRCEEQRIALQAIPGERTANADKTYECPCRYAPTTTQYQL
eukprot:scaffold56140_cov63-Phaeocystis_antarctica.AAC.2